VKLYENDFLWSHIEGCTEQIMVKCTNKYYTYCLWKPV